MMNGMSFSETIFLFLLALVIFGPKKQPKPIRIEVSRLDKDLYRIEVNDSLEPGEYSLTPEGSNQVFCFQVF